MAIGARGKIFSGLRRLGWCVPTQRARNAGRKVLPAGKNFQSFLFYQARAALQQAMCVNRHVEGCGKAACMRSDSAHDEGVFVVDLTLNDAMAEGVVIFSCRYYGLYFSWRVEAGMGKVEFGKDLTLAELVQRLARKLFQRLAEQDKADVTVFRAGAGVGGERDLEGLLKQLVLIMGGLEELDVGRQAG